MDFLEAEPFLRNGRVANHFVKALFIILHNFCQQLPTPPAKKKSIDYRERCISVTWQLGKLKRLKEFAEIMIQF